MATKHESCFQYQIHWQGQVIEFRSNYKKQFFKFNSDKLGNRAVPSLVTTNILGMDLLLPRLFLSFHLPRPLTGSRASAGPLTGCKPCRSSATGRAMVPYQVERRQERKCFQRVRDNERTLKEDSKKRMRRGDQEDCLAKRKETIRIYGHLPV